MFPVQSLTPGFGVSEAPPAVCDEKPPKTLKNIKVFRFIQSVPTFQAFAVAKHLGSLVLICFRSITVHEMWLLPGL